MNAKQHSSSELSKSFYIDDKNGEPASFVYDYFYSSIKNKRRYSNDPKYNYFNTIIKIKDKIQNNTKLYSSVFEKSSKSRKQKSQQLKGKTKKFRYTQLNNYLELKIKKINSKSFKIYQAQQTNNAGISVGTNAPPTVTGINVKLLQYRPKSTVQHRNSTSYTRQFVKSSQSSRKDKIEEEKRKRSAHLEKRKLAICQNFTQGRYRNYVLQC